MCLCMCACVLFVIAKGNGRAHLPHPDLIFLNALTPWQLLMHLQCQSHSSERKDGERQRHGETEIWGGEEGGVCRGEEARSLVTLYVSVLVKNRREKKNLKCVMCSEKPLHAEF